MAIKWTYNPQTQEFKRGFLGIDNVIIEAANKAVEHSALAGVRAGRANIAAVGFSKTWQSSLRYKMMTPKDSLDPKAYVHSTINYFDIFESGSSAATTIDADTWLWLPLPSVPAFGGSGIKFGGVTRRRHMTVSQYFRNIGPLIKLKRPAGEAPILAAVIRRGTKAQPFGKFATRAQLKRGAFKGGRRVKEGLEVIPMFVGVKSVTPGKRFNVVAALKRETENMPKYYEEELRNLNAKKLAAGVS